jgi:5-methylcytosine-specific restriction enzyme subunit McrC
MLKHKVVCTFDEYSENILLNKIIKTTMLHLIKSNKVTKGFVYNLKNVYAYLNEVDIIIDINSIKWSSLKFERINKNYESIIMICRMALNSILLTEIQGSLETKGLVIKKEDYNSLFESFIRNYYKNHYVGLLKSKIERIKWSILEDDTENREIDKIPNMNTDISLICGNTELIIDAKFHKSILSDKGMHGYDKKGIKREDWYQINSYVINKKFQNPNMNISGMLLYAKTNEEVIPDVKANIMGNNLYVRTLDMTNSFKEIEEQLHDISLLVNHN